MRYTSKIQFHFPIEPSSKAAQEQQKSISSVVFYAPGSKFLRGSPPHISHFLGKFKDNNAF
jgi:hypothetical protein